MEKQHQFHHHQLPDGRWERAQTHEGSDCGLSYYSLALAPGQYFFATGYLPSDGSKARVRFADYRGAELISNESGGLVLEKDIEAMQLDTLSRNAPYPINRWFDPEDLMRVDSIGRTQPVERLVAGVRLLRVCGGNFYYRRGVEKLAERWEAHPASSEETKGAKIIRQLLAEPWSAESEPQALFKRCVAALNSPHLSFAAFGMPEGEPSLLWEVLESLAKLEFSHELVSYRHPAPDPQQWSLVMTMVLDKAKSSDVSKVETLNLVRGFTNISPLADAFVPDRFFEEGLLGCNQWFREECIYALSRRQQWQKLIAVGWKLPPEGKNLVMQALVYPHRPDQYDYTRDLIPREPASAEEEKFWDHCLRTIPGAVDCLCYRFGSPTDNTLHNRTVHDALRDYLAQRAEQSDRAPADFELPSTSQAGLVKVLASWHLTEDISLLQRLLAYRGYDKVHAWISNPKKSGESKEYNAHRYSVRAAAKEALLKLGIPVADDLLIEKEVARDS